MTRLLALLLALSACSSPVGNCRAAHATYLAMVAGGAAAGPLEMAQRDVAEICAAVPVP